MTDAEMAAALRAKGWVCREPVEADAPMPEIKVGQRWESSKPGTTRRHILSLNRGGWPVGFETSPGGSFQAASIKGFLTWARKTGARPV